MKAVLFDFDGTLADSRPGIQAAAAAASATVLPGWPPIDVTAHIGPPLRTMFAQSAPGLDDPTLDALAAAFRTAYDGGLCLRADVYPGVETLLGRLAAAGLPLGVVTNKRTAPTLAILHHLGWDQRFAVVLGPDARSPAFATKAEALAEACRRLGVTPASTLYVGDARSDHEAATAAGMDFAAAAWGLGDVLSVPGVRRCERPEALAADIGIR